MVGGESVIQVEGMREGWQGGVGLAGIMEERRCSVERDREGEVAWVCRSTDCGGEVGGLIHGLKPEEEARR